MPAQVVKSGLAAKLGAKLDQSVKAHAADEIKVGGLGQSLPPGIRDGVAKLVDCKFELIPEGKKNAGNYRFVAQAVMVEPESVMVGDRQEKVAGRQTWLFEPMCDTTAASSGNVTSFDQHVANVVQHIGRLGAELDPKKGGDQLESLVNALKHETTNGSPIYFNLSTSVRKAQKAGEADGVWENWNGRKGLEDYQEPDFAAQQTDDQSGAPQEPEQQPDADATAGDADQGVDLDALAAEADGMDLAAALAEDGPGAAINAVAVEVGGEELKAAVGNAATWAEGIELIKAQAGGAEAGAAAEPEPEPWKPAKGMAVGYKPLIKNAKGKMVPGKLVQCEVEAINNKSGTANLCQLANKKTKYANVKIDQLEKLD